MLVSRFRIQNSGFEIRDSGFGIRASRFGVRSSGSGIQVAGVELSMLPLASLVSGSHFRVSEFGFRVSG
jgi:hypothetical protein